MRYLLIGLLTGVLNGFFGSGGGVVSVFFLQYLLKLEKHKAHATAILIILLLTVVSLFVYSKNNLIDYDKALPVIIGGVLGGVLGAKFLKNISSSMLGKIFGVLMIISGLKMMIG